jgi:trimeric autotransporter adhesin
MLSTRQVGAGLVALLVSCGPTLSQCAWDALAPPGTSNVVYCMTEWDPDGAGPLPPRLVVGGNFPMAGGNSAIRQLAAFDGTTWTGFGSGFALGNPAAIYAVAVLNTGELVAGGDFQTANGVSAAYVARWTGTTWAPMGSGMNSPVRALAVTPSGLLIAGGDFTIAGGVTCNHVAKWNGTAWSSMAGGVSNGSVFALCAFPNGDVVVGGNFFFVSSMSMRGVARWNSSSNTWSPLGSGTNPGIFGTVLALLRTTDGELYAAGGFTIANGGPADNIARFESPNWVSVAGGMNQPVNALGQASDGSVIAGGQFTIAGGGASGMGPGAVPASKIARLQGGVWAAMANGGAGAGGMYRAAGAGSAIVEVIRTLSNGDLGVGGVFTIVGNPEGQGGVTANYIARWACARCGSPDFNGDGDIGTDADIEAFFACLGGNCCATCGSPDFNGDGDIGTDADIESFFRVLGGGSC